MITTKIQPFRREIAILHWSDFSVTITLGFKTSLCINGSIVWRWAICCLAWNYNKGFKVEHTRPKSGDWHLILPLHGFILTCCDIYNCFDLFCRSFSDSNFGQKLFIISLYNVENLHCSDVIILLVSLVLTMWL